jgi:thiamine-phosphate pyrophosphorylase
LHDLKLGGFHFKRETLNNISEKDLIENLKMLKGSSIKSSVTAHDLSELNKYDGQFDIVLISPLFDSISKKEYHGNWDFEKLKIFIENRKSLSTLLIGQGGIDDKNVSEVQSLGLDGYTLLGYLWNSSENVIENFKKLSDGDRR